MASAKAQDFKTNLLLNLDKAESAGEVGRAQARRLRRHAENPQKLARMEAEATAIVFDDNPNAIKFGTSGSIDWSKVFATFSKFMAALPGLIKLFAAFGG